MYNTGNTANINNNYKWTMTFKKCESLCCTPVTYIMLYINYSSVKEKRSECLRTRLAATVAVEWGQMWNLSEGRPNRICWQTVCERNRVKSDSKLFGLHIRFSKTCIWVWLLLTLRTGLESRAKETRQAIKGHQQGTINLQFLRLHNTKPTKEIHCNTSHLQNVKLPYFLFPLYCL